jgi:DNA polymerase III alpha subunit (gram-positive type)
MIEIPVSVGELIDKITILKIKVYKIKDALKLSNVTKELSALQSKLSILNITDEMLDIQRELQEVNESLWGIEDDLRIMEKNEIFDMEFINKARSVYKLNDKRFLLKKKLNIISDSKISEEKSYE